MSGLIFIIFIFLIGGENIAKITKVLAAPLDESLNENFEITKNCPCTTATPANQSTLPMISTHLKRRVIIQGMSCICDFGVRNVFAPARDDYFHSPGIGAHKLHTRAIVWNQARKLCNDEGGHLAIINSVIEERILLDIFNRSGPVKGSPYPSGAFLGIHDLYEEGDWVTINGESLAKTGFTNWSDKWGGQPDNGGGRQNCGALLKDGGLDDVACDVPFAFFCELPLSQSL